MAPYLDLEKAVGYLIDETPEGAPFRDGKVFVRGDYISVVDPNHPLHRQVRSVIGTGCTSDGKATVRLRGNTVANPNHPLLNNTDGGTAVFVVDARDTVVLADCCRRWHGKLQQHIDDWTRRRLFALPLIVRACVEGRWKADGKKPGSAKRKDIRARDFIGSEIDEHTSDLMSTPGPTSTRPENTVAIWTDLMFSVPGGADEGKAAELPEPAIRAAATRTKAETERQYLEHVERTKSSQDRYPTIVEDEAWRKNSNVNVTRPRMRELRKKHNRKPKGGAPKKLGRKT